jgi:hypothetical protein
MLKAEGFDGAIVGVGTHFNTDVIIYNYDDCVQILVDRDGMTYEEAIEFMEYNVCGAWVGQDSPVFYRGSYEEDDYGG